MKLPSYHIGNLYKTQQSLSLRITQSFITLISAICKIIFTMGITTFTQEYSSAVAPSRMFQALIIDSRTLIPKLLPQFVKEVNLIQGSGEAGSIEQVNFNEASPFKYMKQRIDVLDKDNLVCKYTMIEGDPLGDKLESIAYEVKFEATSDGGCVCKMSSSYNTIGDYQVTEEEVKEGRESTIGIYKVVESYLQGNPDVYA